jgi:hypothetical protein
MESVRDITGSASPVSGKKMCVFYRKFLYYIRRILHILLVQVTRILQASLSCYYLFQASNVGCMLDAAGRGAVS